MRTKKMLLFVGILLLLICALYFIRNYPVLWASWIAIYVPAPIKLWLLSILGWIAAL